jgi:PEP-CTERM motif
MRTKISNPALKQPFEKRLMRYALAGGALLAAPAAHASIIYSGSLGTLVPANGSPLTVSFDPLAAGATDFTLTVSSTTSPSTTISVAPAPGGLLDVGPLAYGTPITLADTTLSGTTNLVQIKGSSSGAWLNFSSPAYLGVQFYASSQPYLAWVELQLDQNAPSATLLGWAYNDQPFESINAGDTGLATIPEPSSLTLFALGAAGVLALRRRRRTA